MLGADFCLPPFFTFAGRSLWRRRLGEGNLRRFPTRILQQIPQYQGKDGTRLNRDISQQRLAGGAILVFRLPWETTEDPFSSLPAEPFPQAEPQSCGVTEPRGDGNK